MMKETNIHSQVTSTIAGDDGEAMEKSEGNVAENGFVATDPTHFGKTYHDKQTRYTCCPWGCFLTTFVFVRVEDKNLNEIRFRSDVYKMLSEPGKSAPYAIPDTKFDNFSEREFEEKVATSIIQRLMAASASLMTLSVFIGRYQPNMPSSLRKIRSMQCWRISIHHSISM